MSEVTVGPKLETYLETRLNLLTVAVDAKLAGIEAKLLALHDVIDERDRLYKERDESRRTAVDAALTAVKEGTKGTFEASEKAIVKSDINAEKWRENANEWRAAMMDRETRFASRSEMDNEFKSLRTEVTGLKERLDLATGRGTGGSDMWKYVTMGFGFFLTLISIASGLFVLIKIGT
jgi:hypothetical protein